MPSAFAVQAVNFLLKPFVNTFHLLNFLVVTPFLLLSDVLLSSTLLLPFKLGNKLVKFSPDFLRPETFVELLKVLYQFLAVAVIVGTVVGLIDALLMHLVNKLFHLAKIQFTIPLIDVPVTIEGDLIDLDEKTAAATAERRALALKKSAKRQAAATARKAAAEVAVAQDKLSARVSDVRQRLQAVSDKVATRTSKSAAKGGSCGYSDSPLTADDAEILLNAGLPQRDIDLLMSTKVTFRQEDGPFSPETATDAEKDQYLQDVELSKAIDAQVDDDGLTASSVTIAEHASNKPSTSEETNPVGKVPEVPEVPTEPVNAAPEKAEEPHQPHQPAPPSSSNPTTADTSLASVPASTPQSTAPTSIRASK